MVQAEVTEEELQKAFQANYGERVEVQAIVVASNRQAQQVWEQARGNPSREFFARLAEQYSIDPVSRGNEGLVPPIRMHGGQPIIENEAFKLKPGGLSTILAIEDKFVIMRCVGRTRPIAEDFNAVKDELLQDLHEKKLRLAMAQKFESLRESAQIDNFLANTTQSGRTRVSAPAPRTDPAVQPASGPRAAAPRAPLR
jgi:parvulin-like peptidyl-prolyl isomerase